MNEDIRFLIEICARLIDVERELLDNRPVYAYNLVQEIKRSIAERTDKLRNEP